MTRSAHVTYLKLSTPLYKAFSFLQHRYEAIRIRFDDMLNWIEFAHSFDFKFHKMPALLMFTLLLGDIDAIKYSKILLQLKHYIRFKCFFHFVRMRSRSKVTVDTTCFYPC